MMDEFLSQFRESPRPAFAHDLAAHLAAAPHASGARRSRFGRQLGAVGLSLLIAFGWAALGHQAGAPGSPRGAQPVALLLPISAHAVVSAAPRWTTVDTVLMAPPTPLSHHH